MSAAPKGVVILAPQSHEQPEGTIGSTVDKLRADAIRRGLPRRRTRRTRVYIAGPMTGIAEYNFPAFFAAEKVLAEVGYQPVNPARKDMEIDGFDGSEPTTQPFEHYMNRDIPLVLTCDGIAVLPDWWKSRGGRSEVSVALLTGRFVISAETLDVVEDAAETIKSTRHLFPDYLI